VRGDPGTPWFMNILGQRRRQGGSNSESIQPELPSKWRPTIAQAEELLRQSAGEAPKG